MILYLVGDGVVEKSVLFTALTICKPSNFEIMDELPTASISKFPKTKNAIVLKSAWDLVELTPQNVKKLKKFVEGGKIKFIKLPNFFTEVEEAKTDEARDLQSLEIPLENVFGDAPDDAYTHEIVGNLFQEYLENTYQSEIDVSL